MAEFVVLFAAAMGGYAGVGVWAVAVSASLLIGCSYSNRRHVYVRAKNTGRGYDVGIARLSVVAYAVAATSGLFLSGQLLRLL